MPSSFSDTPKTGLGSMEWIKREELIEQILSQQPVDVDALFAISRLEGGFMSNNIRKKVWPKLIGLNRYDLPDYRTYIDPHCDDSQVRCDVERSLWNYKDVREWDDDHREERRKALSNIIMAVLSRNSNLHYFQGYHDLISVILLVLEEDHLTFSMAEFISLTYFRDCMAPDFEIVSKSMQSVMYIIQSADKELYKFLSDACIEPFFATSWIITWFSHDIKKLDKIARIFDVMLCTHPLMSMYVSAAIVIHFRNEILANECEFSILHNFIVHIPEILGIPFEDILKKADKLMISVTDKDIIKLANQELKTLIKNDGIALFTNPKGYLKFVESDWVLQKNTHLSSPKFPLFYKGKNALLKWGWKKSFSQRFFRIDSNKVHPSLSSNIDDSNENKDNNNNNNNHDISNDVKEEYHFVHVLWVAIAIGCVINFFKKNV
jgi:hypothetical protein